MDNLVELAGLRGFRASPPLRPSGAERHAVGMTSTPDSHDAHPDVGFLTEEEIREFQALVQATTGVMLDHDTAAKRASQLLYLVRALVGRLPEDSAMVSSNIVQP